MGLKVLAFGEILWDVIEGVPSIGGAPLNFAAHIRQLGGTSSLLSAVGRDELGDRAVAFLDSWGVDTGLVQRNGKPTGEVPVSLKGGIPSYEILTDRAWDAIAVDDRVLEQTGAGQWDVLYYGSLAQRTETNREGLSRLRKALKFDHVFFDVNLRQNWFSREVLEDSLRGCTILKLNDEEVPVVSGLVFRRVLSDGEFSRKVREDFEVGLTVITRGEKGAGLYRGEEVLNLTPPKVKAVDTVGAGDSFSAAFLYSYCLHGDLLRAGQTALAVAAYVVTHPGAVAPYPEELKKLL